MRRAAALEDVMVKYLAWSLLGSVLGGGSAVFITGLVLEVSPPIWTVGAFIGAVVAIGAGIVKK